MAGKTSFRLFSNGARVVQGDASKPEVLVNAGIERASATLDEGSSLIVLGDMDQRGEFVRIHEGAESTDSRIV